MESLPSDWIELIGLLVRHRVRFLVVGAHALAAHGRPRLTADLDLLVEPTALNARRLGAALAEFGFGALAAAVEREMATADRMLTLGRELRVDIMNAISGVTFAEAWAGRKRTALSGHRVSVIGHREFVRNKKASGRAKDLLDLALLAEVAERPSRGRKAPRGRPS